MLRVLLSRAETLAIVSFVVSNMLAMGAGLTVAQIIEPLRNARLVALALLANFRSPPLRWPKSYGSTIRSVSGCCSVARPARRFSRNSPNLQRATLR